MTGFIRGVFRFRRGPWEMLATILIALGVFMLMQPFMMWGLHLLIHNNSRWHGDVYHRSVIFRSNHG